MLSAEIDRAMAPVGRSGGNIHELRRALQDVMWDDVGVIRTADGMTRALQRLDEIDTALMETGVAAGNLAFNLTWHDWLNMRSLVDISKVITHAGLARENSRGAHYREDFPEVGELESSYFTKAITAGDDVKVTRTPVAFTIVKPGETILPAGEPDTLVAAAE
jgi:fumarate reductase flavoprotein subunit